jgi:PIN domain nuclease of toxin-antitoxin system
MLVSRQRLTVTGRPQIWYSRVLSLPGVSSAYMPEELLIESSFLPGNPPGDPADRIIITTAREYGYTIVTRDRKILDYADQGYVKAMPC